MRLEDLIISGTERVFFFFKFGSRLYNLRCWNSSVHQQGFSKQVPAWQTYTSEGKTDKTSSDGLATASKFTFVRTLANFHVKIISWYGEIRWKELTCDVIPEKKWMRSSWEICSSCIKTYTHLLQWNSIRHGLLRIVEKNVWFFKQCCSQKLQLYNLTSSKMERARYTRNIIKAAWRNLQRCKIVYMCAGKTHTAL